MSTYVMSDIHGCYTEFMKMLDKISFSDNDKLILAGDYIDRGNQNIEMMLWIETHILSDNIVILRGNHEEEFSAYIDLMIQIDKQNELCTDYTSVEDSKLLYESCFYLIKQKNPLGLLVFDTYGTIYSLISKQRICFNELIKFNNTIRKMPFYYQVNRNIIIAHAGYSNNTLDKNKYCLYGTDNFHETGGQNNSIIIFGHSPTIFNDGKYSNHGDMWHYYNAKNNCEFYNIDCGVAYKKEYPDAKLCCLCIDDFKCKYI